MLDVIHIILNAKIILFFKQTKHSSFFSLFINYLNKGILLPLSIVISTILFFLFSLCMFGLFIPFKKELKHLKHVYYGERAKCKGVISSIGGIVSLPSFGKGLEIVLKDKVDTWVVYFDCNLEELPFKEKEEVHPIKG